MSATVILLGPPAAGKGTQAARLRDRSGFLRVYHRETAPLVGHYEARGLLRRVDGAQDADSVEDGVRAALS